MLSVFDIITLEPVAGVPPIYDINTPDVQLTCYQTVLKFRIWLAEMFSKSVFLRLI